MKDPIETWLKGGAHGVGTAAGILDLVRGEPEGLARLASHLASSDPQVRGGAAEAMAAIAEPSPEAVLPFVDDLVAALEQEETRTRLGACRTIAAIAAIRPESLAEDIDVIRLGVFDPAHADIRGVTALILGRFGTGDPARGRRVFPHLAEAFRRFHDRGGANDLLEGIAALCEVAVTAELGKEIWKAVRAHEKNADPRIREVVSRIAARVRQREL